MGLSYELGLGLWVRVMGYVYDVSLGFFTQGYELRLGLSVNFRVYQLGLEFMSQFQDIGQGLWLVLVVRVRVMSQGQGYVLGLGLWVSNHNDYFYVVHRTRIINKVIKKK